MPLFDFRCSNGHTIERLRQTSADVDVPCPVCGQPSRRTGVNLGIGIVGPTTDTRGMFRRYREANAEINDSAARFERDTGTPAPTPNLWQVAKTEAAARVAAGEAPAARKG